MVRVRPTCTRIPETECGTDLTGWLWASIDDVSGDGDALVGSGISPKGNNEGLIILIPARGTAGA